MQQGYPPSTTFYILCGRRPFVNFPCGVQTFRQLSSSFRTVGLPSVNFRQLSVQFEDLLLTFDDFLVGRETFRQLPQTFRAATRPTFNFLHSLDPVTALDWMQDYIMTSVSF